MWHTSPVSYSLQFPHWAGASLRIAQWPGLQVLPPTSGGLLVFKFICMPWRTFEMISRVFAYVINPAYHHLLISLSFATLWSHSHCSHFIITRLITGNCLRTRWLLGDRRWCFITKYNSTDGDGSDWWWLTVDTKYHHHHLSYSKTSFAVHSSSPQLHSFIASPDQHSTMPELHTFLTFFICPLEAKRSLHFDYFLRERCPSENLGDSAWTNTSYNHQIWPLGVPGSLHLPYRKWHH